MWPLSHHSHGEENYFFLMPLESACWVHICKPLDWNVIPSEPAFFKEFICLKQTEEECSLPRFYFQRQKSFGCRRERNSCFFRIDLKRKEVFFQIDWNGDRG